MVALPSFWIVLPLSVAVFWLLPRPGRLWFLSAVSFGFLCSLPKGAWKPAVGLLVWVLLFWFLVRAPDQLAAGGRPRRSHHMLLIAAVLLQLAWFKYLPPLIEALSSNPLERSVVVPLGMSFFTFKLVHYAFEVSRGTVGRHSFVQFLSYMFLFPIFTAGPIERFDHYLTHQEPRWSLESTAWGVTRVAIGVIKRFLFAEALLLPLTERYAVDVFGHLGDTPAWRVWVYLMLSFAYVYMDFSAYSDIGIGASRMFGLGIMENFRFPLIACDISDFWKRWHISLSRWCQSYVYMPTIGKTRNPYLATYATFFVMGLRHAGTFNRIGWGMYHATGIAVFVSWTQFKRRRGLKKLFKRPLLRYAGLPITLLFIAGSAAFLVAEAEGLGLQAACRILLRLVPVHLG